MKKPLKPDEYPDLITSKGNQNQSLMTRAECGKKAWYAYLRNVIKAKDIEKYAEWLFETHGKVEDTELSVFDQVLKKEREWKSDVE